MIDLKKINNKYESKHINTFNKNYKTIASGFQCLKNGISWLYYTIDNVNIVITTKDNRIIDIIESY